MPVSRITPVPLTRHDGMVELAADVELKGQTRRAWFRLPAEHAGAVTAHGDPFLIGLIFPLMAAGDEVEIAAAVSPSLVRHLQVYMALWHAWEPAKYRMLRIVAAEDRELPAADPPKILCPYSCGVDSNYTFLRHYQRALGGRSLPIHAATAILGFDIPLNQTRAIAAFAAFQARAREFLDQRNIPLIPMINNLRVFAEDWNDAHLSGLVGAHCVLAGGYAGMLLPNSLPLSQILVRWGTNPLIDPLLAPDHFRIVDDGGDVTRAEKLKFIARTPEAFDRIHVCACTPGRFDNCGTCGKCIQTLVCCRIAGLRIPRTFRRPAEAADVKRLRLNHPLKFGTWQEACDGLQAAGLGATDLARAARALVRRAKIRRAWHRALRPLIPLRNRIRAAFRGTTASRSEQAARTKRLRPPDDDSGLA